MAETPERRTIRLSNLKLRRDKLRALGLCRDCRKPSGGRLRCPSCQREKSLPSLEEWQMTQRILRDHLQGLQRSDRRQNGSAAFALSWALLERSL